MPPILNDLDTVRYKVIASFPGGPIVDTVIPMNGVKLVSNPNRGWIEFKCTDYPHLFKPLKWYEEREVREMPLYVKYGSFVIKVNHWAKDEHNYLYCSITAFQNTFNAYPSEITPSTVEEYSEQFNHIGTL